MRSKIISSPAEVIDRYTILLLKYQNGINVEKELAPYLEAVVDYAEMYSDRLYDINSRMWELEDRITEEGNLKKVGALYMQLRDLTLQRMEVKNEITKKYGGFKEKKNFI